MLSTFSFSEDTVGFIIEDTFNIDTVEKLQELILNKLNEYNKINLYLEDCNIEEFTLDAVVKEINFKVNYNNRFNKIALVSDRKWIKMCVAVENLFLSPNIKSFHSEDRLNAISWIAKRA